jgi:chromate transporter
MIFLQLFYTFFIIGLFGFGGGYGMLSLIQTETVYRHHWLSTAEFTNIVAVSQMTPGPIGINSATYCGYEAVRNAGYGEFISILGSATTTIALVLPSFIIMILIAKLFMKYMNTPAVQSIFSGLRPAVVGLLAAATLLLLTSENFSSPSDTTTVQPKHSEKCILTKLFQTRLLYLFCRTTTETSIPLTTA